MRAFLRRWRWWLLGAALAAATLCTVATLHLLNVKRSARAFDQVQVGMTLVEADRIFTGAHATEFGTGPAGTSHRQTVYWLSGDLLGDDLVLLESDANGVLDHKSRTHDVKLDWSDRFEVWWNGIRAALGL
jgi:hypothetical protein